MHAVRRIKSSDKRLPFTVDDLQKLVSAIPIILEDPYQQTMYKAMILTAFFGLLRVGEMAQSKHGHENIIKRQSVQEVYINSKVKYINISMSVYKHSQGQPTIIPVSRQPLREICPVRALLQYMQDSPCQHGPLFRFRSGASVSVSDFRSVLRSLVVECHLDPTTYTSHSLRIGGATHAHLNNMSTAQICRLGRWKSTAYKKYIRTDALPISTSTVQKPPSLL